MDFETLDHQADVGEKESSSVWAKTEVSIKVTGGTGMSATKEGMVQFIRVVDSVRVVRKLYDRKSPPMIPDIIRALADAPGLTDAELGLIVNAEREASRLSKEKGTEIKQLRAQDGAGS